MYRLFKTLTRAQKVCLVLLILAELIGGFWFSSRLLVSSPDIFFYILIVLVFFIALTVFVFWLFFIKCPTIYGHILGKSYLIKLAVFSIAAGGLLEGLTLFGAPVSSPLKLSDWHLSRIVFFTLLSSPLIFWVMLFPWRERFCHIMDFLLRDSGKNGKLIIRNIVVLFLVAFIVGLSAYGICIFATAHNTQSYMFFSIAVALTVTLFILGRKKIFLNPEWGFLLIILSVGILYFVLLPARSGISWDDQIHFNQANAMSYIVDAQYTDNDRFEAEIPANENDVNRLISGTMNFDSSIDSGSSFTDYTPEKSSYNSGTVVTMTGTKDSSGTSWVSFSSIGRIPFAIGLWIGRLLHLSFGLRFCFARFVNLLFYSIVCFFALRKLKSGKLIVGAVLSLPLAVFLASNYSYDAWLLCFFAYSFCSYLRVLQSPDLELTRRDALSILVPGVLALTVKAVFFPLILMYLLMPSSKFTDDFSRKRFSLWVLLSCFALILSFVLPFLISLLSGSATGDIRGGGGVNSGGQVSFLLQNPLSFIDILIKYAAAQFVPTVLFDSMTSACYLDVDIPVVVSLLLLTYFVALVLLDRSECDCQYAFARYRLAALGSILFSYVLVVLALYVSYTPVGASRVEGVQLRYFLPCYIPLFAMCCNFRTKINIRKEIINSSAIFISYSFLIYCFVSSVVTRF